jgi:hypothetical protein
MRPLFAIAPLALAFVLLGPTTTDASSAASPSLAAKVWQLIFDRDATPAQVKPAGNLATTTSALAQ